ncbi:unnamed protein product [Sympodiomycopsis kandeliae]
MIRSASFNTGQPPANKPFSFGGGASSTTNNNTSSTGGGFSFGNNNNNNTSTSQPAASTSGGFSFGGPSSSTTQQQQQPSTSSGGFSFGAPANSTAGTGNTNTAGGGLFGSSTSQAKPSGFSFGQPAAASNSATNNATGGLFGNSSAGGSLFGTGTAQPAATSGTAGGLFGGGGSTSLFGGGQQQQQQQQQQPQQQQQSTSFFGQSQQQPQFGQQQQQAPSALLSHPFYQKERFNDLSEDSRKLLEELQKHITNQTSLRDELTPKLIPSSSSSSNLSIVGQEISTLYNQLRQASGSLSTISNVLDNELSNVKRIAEGVETDRRDFVNLWEIGNAFKETHLNNNPNPQTGNNDPSQLNPSLSSSTSQSNLGLEVRKDFLLNYLSKQVTDFQTKTLKYKSTISQIEKQLQSLDYSSARDTNSPQSISDILHFQYSTFINLTNQVVNLHSEIDILRNDYRNWYAKQYRSAKDPFDQQS